MARILVVDDESVVAQVVGKVLEAMGHEAVISHTINGAMDAIKASGETPFDLLVTDHDIVGSGKCFDMFARGLAECPDQFPRRVIIMSGYFPADMDEHMVGLCNHGFMPFTMQKPALFGKIVAFVNYMLSLQRVAKND